MPAELIKDKVQFEFVRLDRRGEVILRSPGEALRAVEPLAPGVTLELVAICAPLLGVAICAPLLGVALSGGFFQMGSRDEGGYPDELPIHPVFLAPFWLGRFPVNQAQWQAVMGRLPDCRFHGPNLPVDTICWAEARAFCEQLSGRTGRRYTLPSEAQWEYACRAGTRSPFSLGETISTDYANFVGLHTYAQAPPGVYRHGPLPVGSFPPNPWGLFDMHGSMWEFCADAWAPDYTGAPMDGSPRAGARPPVKRAPSDFISEQFGQGEQAGFRVARGGSWHETPAHCRSAMRLQVSETERMEYYGLRVLLSGAV